MCAAESVYIEVKITKENSYYYDRLTNRRKTVDKFKMFKCYKLESLADVVVHSARVVARFYWVYGAQLNF